MKYDGVKVPIRCYQTQSTCFRGTHAMEVYGVLWHSTGANNPWVKRYVQPDDDAIDRTDMLNLLGKNQYGNDWNHTYHEAGLNAWIGKLADGSVVTVQTMPWDYAPWGCGVAYKGGPSCNSHWIQFEICEDGLDDPVYFNQVYTEACELTAYLCKLFNVDPQGAVRFAGKDVPTILCHQDSYQYGVGCNHGDIYHWFKRHGKTMQSVRDDVEAIMSTFIPQPKPSDKTDDSEVSSTLPVYNQVSDCPGYAQPTISKMIDKGFISGTGTGRKDSEGRPADLSLSLDMLRVFVVMDRAGVFG